MYNIWWWDWMCKQFIHENQKKREEEKLCVIYNWNTHEAFQRAYQHLQKNYDNKHYDNKQISGLIRLLYLNHHGLSNEYTREIKSWKDLHIAFKQSIKGDVKIIAGYIIVEVR